MRFAPLAAIVLSASLAAALSACSSLNPFSDDKPAAAAQQPGPPLGVNAVLWRASLDTLNFMPLASQDPVGGVINTDWYAAPENPNERMKVTVYILDRRLRADALKVSVFRQITSSTGWVDAQVNPDTAVKLENAILMQARTLNLTAAPQE